MWLTLGTKAFCEAGALLGTSGVSPRMPATGSCCMRLSCRQGLFRIWKIGTVKSEWRLPKHSYGQPFLRSKCNCTRC
ncbi:mCG1032161 [Mus musculus]|nr:mCG1032161 [Mus musculus]